MDLNPQATSYQPWHPQQHPQSFYIAVPIPEPSGTFLFDQVRAQFCDGIATLENVLRYMEVEGKGIAECKLHAKGIDDLLENMVVLARWLVGFLDRATACQRDSMWTRRAMTGVRCDLHAYSWRVMRISMVLRREKSGV